MGYEKCIILTIIDPELVNLVKAMHSKYAEYGHGTFTGNYPNEVGYMPKESESYIRLAEY